MDRIAGMEAFARVARLGSFTAAGRELRLSTTAVSRRVSDLEEHLGVRLLERNTRRLSLTEAGVGTLDRCEQILDDLDELEGSARLAEGKVRGLLRVTAGIDLGRDHLAPAITAFQRVHPDTRVDLYLSDHFVDLVAEGFDVAVRMGVLQDSSLVARRLAASRLVIVASPDYLARNGSPRRPEDLREHACILDTNGSRRWSFVGPQGRSAFTPRPRFAVNSPSVTRDRLLAGQGVSVVPRFVVVDELRAGRLVPVLPGYELDEIPLHAVYPPGRRLSTRVRAFVDALAESFAGWQASDA